MLGECLRRVVPGLLLEGGVVVAVEQALVDVFGEEDEVAAGLLELAGAWKSFACAQSPKTMTRAGLLSCERFIGLRPLQPPPRRQLYP